jgi:hypothetical protein
MPVALVSAPGWQTPPWITIILFVIQFLGFGVVVYRVNRDQKKDRRDDEEYLMATIRRVCREFTNENEFTNGIFKDMTMIATSTIDEEFRLRASTFADAKSTTQAIADVNLRISDVQASIDRKLSALRDGIRTDMTAQATDIVDRVAARLRG